MDDIEKEKELLCEEDEIYYHNNPNQHDDMKENQGDGDNNPS